MTEDQAPAPGPSLSFDCALADAPEKVWRALTIPELVAAWLAPNDLSAEPGARFTLKGGSADRRDVACEILAADPGRMLRYRWRTGTPDGRGLDSVVTFILSGTADGGTRLRIVHDGFAAIEARAAEAPTLRSAARNRRPAAMSSNRSRASSPSRRPRPPLMRMAA